MVSVILRISRNENPETVQEVSDSNTLCDYVEALLDPKSFQKFILMLMLVNVSYL